MALVAVGEGGGRGVRVCLGGGGLWGSGVLWSRVVGRGRRCVGGEGRLLGIL